MIIDDKPFRLCWTVQDARSVFRTEALEGDDAVFLATHSPITGYDVAGTYQGEFEARTEQAALATLSDPERRHAFCVVQGEPGSGKSHLIRWLSVKWPHQSDLKLLLRRSDGSLEGALRQLREKLGPEFEHLFQNLGVRQKASPQGRASNFLATLANSLHPGYYEEKIGDEVWCGRHRPDLLFNHVRAREGWPAPMRIVKLLEGAGGERNSASASFDLYDLADFDLDALRRLQSELSDPAAKDLARHLEREIGRMTHYREAGWTADEIAGHKAFEVPTSLALLAALNRRRNDSIQSVLGVTADGLKTLFRGVRKALQARGMRLVLLLEDITSWEGLDDSLIDVLVFNAAAQGHDGEADVCPLISIVGVTPKYYGDLKPNYRQRITHEIVLGTSSGGAQDVASLRDPVERTAFVTRYLAAVRAGPRALVAWRDDLRGRPALPPPNVCSSCPKREPCFSTFGSADDVGLFPFTEPAVGRFFEALKIDDKGQTWRTPRGLLQAVLNPVLEQVHAIATDAFPGDLIERGAFEESRTSASAITGRLNQIIEAQVDEVERGRFRRLVTYWGDPDRADWRLVGEVPAFAGLPRPLIEAFGLPWIDGVLQVTALEPRSTGSVGAPPPEAAAASSEPSEAAPRPSPAASAVAAPGSSASRQVRTTGVPGSATSKASGGLTPPRLRGVSRDEREDVRQDLRSWASGSPTTMGSRWNSELHALLMRLDSRQFGVAQSIFERTVTAEMVKLQGTTGGGRDYLDIERADWVRNGLEARLALQADDCLPDADKAFHLRNLALLMRRLEGKAAAYLRRRLPTGPGGAVWSPVPVLAQILVVRAWLRGTLTPGETLARQLRVILSDEAPATTDPKSRSAPWQEWLDKTNPWQARLREDLRELVALPTESGTRGMIDAGELVGALRRTEATGQIDLVPEFARWPSTLGAIAEARGLATFWNEKATFIAATEFRQLRDRGDQIATKLRGRSVDEHVARIDRAITAASIALPTKATEFVQAWKVALTTAQAKPEGILGIEDFILSIEARVDGQDNLPRRLAWLAEQPAGAVETAKDMLQAAEKAVEELRKHAGDIVGDGATGLSLSSIKAVGQALRDASGRGDAARNAA